MLILYGRKQLGLFFLAIGLIFSVFGVVRLIDSHRKPLDFNVIRDSEMKKGLIVEGDIPYNLGKYAYVENSWDGWDGFIVPINSKNYYSLHVKSSDIHAKLMQQSRDTNDMFNDNSKSPEVIHFKGKIKEMPSDEYNTMSSYLKKIGFSQNDIQELVKPYYILEFDVNKIKEGIFFGILVLIFGLSQLIIEYKSKS